MCAGHAHSLPGSGKSAGPRGSGPCALERFGQEGLAGVIWRLWASGSRNFVQARRLPTKHAMSVCFSGSETVLLPKINASRP